MNTPISLSASSSSNIAVTTRLRVLHSASPSTSWLSSARISSPPAASSFEVAASLSTESSVPKQEPKYRSLLVANNFSAHRSYDNTNIIALHEMSKKAEAEPLLSSPSHETQYSTDNRHVNEPLSSSMFNTDDTVHLMMDAESGAPGPSGIGSRPKRPNKIPSTNGSHDTESIQSYQDLLEEDDDVALLQDVKPVITRVQVQNVLLLNFMALVFVFLNMTLNLTVLAVIHERVPMKEPHLPDILFDVLPDIRRFLDITEYYIIVQMVSIFIMLFFHKHRSVIFRRFCIIMGLIYFVRAITMASTQLPLASRNYTCSPQLKNRTTTSFEFIGIIASRVFYMSLGMGLSINGLHNFCGDYIFSGHTVILVLTYLFFREYFMPARLRTYMWRFIQLAQFLMTSFCIVCVVIARGHYFIDIIIAYFVTTRIFYIYHTLCTCNSTNYKAITSYFRKLWWWPVFVYFENAKFVTRYSSGKVEDIQQVQRAFDWPLPWPKRFARRKHRNQFMA